MKDSGIPREEIFITGKLWNTHHPAAAEGLQMTLDALGTEYLDLYVSSDKRCVCSSLIHLAHSLACSPRSCKSQLSSSSLIDLERNSRAITGQSRWHALGR